MANANLNDVPNLSQDPSRNEYFEYEEEETGTVEQSLISMSVNLSQTSIPDDVLNRKGSILSVGEMDMREIAQDESNLIQDYYRRESFGRLDGADSSSKTDVEFLTLTKSGDRSLSLHSESDFDRKPVNSEDKLHDLYTKSPSFIFHSSQISFVTIFEGLALSTILEEVYLQLEILGHAFPGQRVNPDDSDFLTYDERFAIEVKEKDLEFRPTLRNFRNPFIVDETQVGTHDDRMSHKIQKDRAFLQEIIRRAQVELDKKRTFEMLKDNVKREDGRRHEEITLMEREKRALLNVAEMRKKIAEFRNQMFRDEHNRKEMINHLKDQLFQEKQKGRMDARYTRAWFEARNDFNFSQLQHNSDLARLKIKHLEIQMTRDRFVNQNIEAWSLLQFQEIQRKIDDWNFKFDLNLEMIDKRIRDKQDILRAQQAMIEGLRNTIEQRAIALGPWDVEKEQDRQDRAAYMRLYYYARKIQRWWRAYMIKHKLYKAKKKKGKGKGKGKGRGKSKGRKKSRKGKKK